MSDRAGSEVKPAATVEAESVAAEALEATARAEQALAAERGRVEQLLAQTTLDEVTGLLNRRGFADAATRSLARARRYREIGALILMDIAGMEDTRTRLGEDAGNFLVVSVGNLLRTRFRDVDYVARLEGGRFALLLPMIAEEDARRRTATLKTHLDRMSVPWQGQTMRVRARIGLINYGPREATADLLERAEADMRERMDRR